MSNRSKWFEFEQVFKQSEAVSILKNNYSKDDLISFENKYGKCLLHMSVEFNNPKITEYLLYIGCSSYYRINRQDGRSPLALALSLPRVSEELLRLLCSCCEKTRERETYWYRLWPYSWENITGPSRRLEIENEAVADIFRSYVTSSILREIHADRHDDDRNSLKIVELLHDNNWPQEGLSFLGLCDTSTSFSQLYYSVANADAEKVKHCLDNNNFSPRALKKALKKAVSNKNPKSTVIMRLLLDNGVPRREFDEISLGLLHDALDQDNVDMVLLLIHSGAKWNFNNWKTNPGDSCLHVFIKPTIPFDSDLKKALQANYYYNYRIIRYHCRIDSYNFPQEINGVPGNLTRYIEYKEELARMKYTEVYENLTVLDIIDKPLDNIVAYAKNKDLMDKLEAIKFKKSFPLFSGIIRKRLEVACRIRDWVHQSKDYLAECMPAIRSNDLILSKIISYLGVPNLIVMSLK